MEQTNEERVAEWVISAWYFLHHGELPDDLAKRIVAGRALQWGEANMGVVRRFAEVHGRYNTIMIDRTQTRQALAANQSVDFRGIMTPADRAAIDGLLADDAEYQKYKRDGQGWARNPSYEGIRWLTFFLWPIELIAHRVKRKLHEAFLIAESLEYSATEYYFRSLDADADCTEQSQALVNGYWAENQDDAGTAAATG